MKLLLGLLLVGNTALIDRENIDFTGNYVINKEKTNLGPAPEWILPRYLKVEQQANRSLITRTTLNKNLEEQMPVTDTLAFDGSIFIRQTNVKKVNSLLIWKNDSIFIIEKKTLTPDGQLEGSITEQWQLEEEGKTLVINRSIEQSNGVKYATRAVFDRQ